MKRTTPLLLILFIIISLIPIVPGYTEEPEWILEKRGANYEIYYNTADNNLKRWNSAPQWIYNGTKYVPYILENMGDYYTVQSGLIGAEIHREKAVFYDPQLENIAVGRETWLVYKKVDGNWNPVAASLQQYFKSVTVTEGDEQLNITGTWETQKGELNIEYRFKEDLKHTTTWIPNEPGSYAVIQFWNDTQYSDVILGNGTKILRNDGDVIIGKTDSLTFQFGNETQPFGVFENQNSASDFLHKTLFAKGTIYYQGIQITDGVAWIFYNQTLCTVNAGEPIIIDPETATLDPPTEDTHVDSEYPDTNYGNYDSMEVEKSDTTLERALIKFETSSLPANANVTLAYLKAYKYYLQGSHFQLSVHGVSDTSWLEHEVTYNNQPSHEASAIDTIGTGSGNPWLTWDVTTWVNEYIGGNVSFKLKAEDESGTIAIVKFKSKEAGSLVDPELYIEYTLDPDPPTINSASITNMDETDRLYPMYNWYKFELIANDTAGATEFYKAYLRGKNSAATIFEIRADNLNSTPTFSIETGSNIIDLDSSACSWTENGVLGNATFLVRIEYDHTQLLNLDLDAYAEDINGTNTNWVNAQTDYFDVITNLVNTFNLDDSRGNLSQSVTASGNVTFEGSTLSPSNSNFTSVSVYDSGDSNKGTDNTITDGHWEITFDTPGTVGIETYNLFINMANPDYTDGEEPSPTDTFINDRYNVTQFWASSYIPQIGENVTLYAIFESEYDSHTCDGDDAITIENLDFIYDPIEEYCYAETSKDEMGTHYYDTLTSIYEDTYEVQDGNLDYNLSISWGEVYYELHGLFLENGTYSGNTTINIHFTDDLDTFTLEQYIEKNYDNTPLMISWPLSGGGTRRIYLISGNETHYIFAPYTDYQAYSFEIKDYSGVVGSGNAYLESYLIINGTERLIERVLIRDTLTPTSLLLQKDLTYRIQIRVVGGTVYDQGYFTPSVDTIPTFIIEDVDWGDQIHFVGQYIMIEFSRPDPEYIQANYKDDLEESISILLEICLINGTQIWNATSTEQIIQFNWYDAINTTDYLVKITAQHTIFGEITHQAWLPGETGGYIDLPDYDIIGTGATKALAILLIFSAFMLTSRLNGYMGIFIATIVAAIMKAIGFLPEMSYTVCGVVMTLTIMAWLGGGNN